MWVGERVGGRVGGLSESECVSDWTGEHMRVRESVWVMYGMCSLCWRYQSPLIMPKWCSGAQRMVLACAHGVTRNTWGNPIGCINV